MQREIKFRAWDAKKKIMLSHSQSTCMSIGNFFEDISEINDGFGRMTLMQYTGLKDKNGKEIWEGDIVNHTGYGIGFVRHSLDYDAEYAKRHDPMIHEEGFMSAWGVQTERYKQISFATFANWCRPAKYMEIIGNIYENPGLLTLPSGDEKEIK